MLFLAFPFVTGRLGVVFGLEFTLAFSDLLLDFFGDEVNGRVEVTFSILRE